MNTERRAAERRPFCAFFNKYIDGQPHLAEAVEISATGMLVRHVLEPDTLRACYAVELAPEPGAAQPLWLCATPVWAAGGFEALSFVAASEGDRRRLDALLTHLAPG